MRALLGLTLLCVAVALPVSPNHRQTRSPFSQGSASALLEESNAAAGKAVVDILVGLAGGLIYDGGKAIAADGGRCKRGAMNAINTLKANGVDNDLLHYCSCKNMRWDSNARKNDGKKYWKVFARKWTLQKCKFNFAWQICPSRSCPASPRVCDCRKSTVRANVKKNRKAKGYMATLERKYPPNKKVWGYHVKDLKINLHSCSAAHHNAYVFPFVSLPIAAFSSSTNTVNKFAGNPYFWINIEGWTFGDCSGWKKPGVQWTFRYKVNLKSGLISFDTRRSNGRPSHSNGYVPVGNRREQITGYKEKTKALCKEMNAC